MYNQPVGNHGLGLFVVRFDLGPLLQGQTKIAKLKSAYNSLIIGPSSACPRVAQYALVLGCSGNVKSDSSVPAQCTNPAFQPDSSQESVKSNSTCLASRTSTINDQGFSEAVAA